MKNILAIFWIFFKLGCTSFGGPVAHIGYFHNEFVIKRKWMTADEYTHLVSLCQILPGPASSQVGMSLGYLQKKYWGAFAAWLGFTLPSAIIMTSLALGATTYTKLLNSESIHGLKVLAAIVVATALYNMSRSTLKNITTVLIALVSCLFVLLSTHTYSHIVVITLATIFGFIQKPHVIARNQVLQNVNRKNIKELVGFGFVYMIALLITFTALNYINPQSIMALSLRFYRIGSLVFGGGHVVLPLIQSEVVQSGFINIDSFLSGYGLAQIIPGPMFTLSSYIGATAFGQSSPLLASLLCTLALFLPSFLILFAILPTWKNMHLSPRLNQILQSINCAVIGLLAAAYINPITITSLVHVYDYFICALGLYLLINHKTKIWMVTTFILVFYNAIIYIKF